MQHLCLARGRSCTSARQRQARCRPQRHAASAAVPGQHHISSPLQQLLVSFPLLLARCLQMPHWVRLPGQVPESCAAGMEAASGSAATHVLQGAGQAKSYRGYEWALPGCRGRVWCSSSLCPAGPVQGGMSAAAWCKVQGLSLRVLTKQQPQAISGRSVQRLRHAPQGHATVCAADALTQQSKKICLQCVVVNALSTAHVRGRITYWPELCVCTGEHGNSPATPGCPSLLPASLLLNDPFSRSTEPAARSARLAHHARSHDVSQQLPLPPAGTQLLTPRTLLPT